MVAEHTASDEEVQFCFVAGSPLFSSADYVVITSTRVLILDERYFGQLGAPYINVQCDLPFDSILSVQSEQPLRHRLFRQMTLKLRVADRTYLIENVGYGDGKRALALLRRFCR